MTSLRSRTGLILAGLYASLGLLALGFALFLLLFDPAHSEFSGLYLILVAVPWSLPALRLLDLFPVSERVLPYAASGVLMACVAVNSVLLYVVSWGLGRALGEGRGRR